MQRYTTEIIHPHAIPELGIAANTTLAQILAIIGQKLGGIDLMLEQELFPQQPPKTSDEIVFNGDTGVANLGIEAQKLAGSELKIDLTRQEEAMELKYNALDFKLPEGAKVASVQVNIAGQKYQGRTTIISGKNPEMQIPIAYNRFPITLESRVIVATKTGDVEMKKTMTISAEAQSKSEVVEYEVIDRSASPSGPSPLTDKIKQLETRLAKAESRVNTLEKK